MCPFCDTRFWYHGLIGQITKMFLTCLTCLWVMLTSPSVTSTVSSATFPSLKNSLVIFFLCLVFTEESVYRLLPRKEVALDWAASHRAASTCKCPGCWSQSYGPASNKTPSCVLSNGEMQCELIELR